MPVKEASVFKETYENYLGQISEADFKKKAPILGGDAADSVLTIAFFGESYSVSPSGVFDPDGRQAPFAISVVLLKYLIMCPDSEPEGGLEWATFRDFKDAGPLTSYFTGNTNKTIEQAFSGKPHLLEKACLALKGKTGSFKDSYDLSMELNALPKIPVTINFNDSDDEFPAASTILFRQSAERYLDMECVAIIGTYLAGNLLKYGTIS